MTNLGSLPLWVETESPTHYAPGVNSMMDRVTAELDGLPIAAERISGRNGLGDHIILRAGPQTGAKSTLVMSHLDTVHPLGTLLDDLPFRQDGDKLYGPGIYDMKGGAWLAFQAFKDVVAAGTANNPLVYLFTADEEIGSPTSREIIEGLSRNAAFALVTEPARDGGRVVTGRKGVGRFEVEIEGVPAHSGARHQDGRSAISEAARQILDIEALTDYARGITTTVAIIKGGTAPNVIPHRAFFTIDLRVVEPADGARLEAHLLALKAHNPDVKIRITGGMNRPPMKRNDATARLFETARICMAEIGIDLGEVALTGGGSDGNFSAALGVPTLDGLGIDGEGAHTLQEHGLISSIAPRRHLMKRLLEVL